MDITPLISSDRQVIQGYAQGGFKISNGQYKGAVIVFPDRTIAWPVGNRDLLTPDDFLPLLTGGLDVVLLGCGARAFPPPPAIRAALKAKNISLDTMDTGAACRTYNVLMAEGRRIAAALLPL